MFNAKYIVVGAGFFGSVIAERIGTVLNEKVIVLDKRSHIGGNSYSETNPATNIECHKYGSHIFHTSNEKVWRYINRFTSFTPYQHKVLIQHAGKTYFMPINLKTINEFYNTNLSPAEAIVFLQNEIVRGQVANPTNLEEKAISLIGRPLYETFIRGYTLKQWECDPRDLPADIITRLPIRTNYEVNYFNDPYQGVPLDGYGALFEKLLNHHNIEVRLNSDFKEVRQQLPADCKIIYTGMIDELFDFQFGVLDWRSLRFEWETIDRQDFQGTTVMNYGDLEVPYTRIHEFKHYHPERKVVFDSGKTVICREYSKTYQRGEEAYYPVNNKRNQDLLHQYEALVSATPNLIMGGRLGCYRYWDMDKAIENALSCFENKIQE